MSPCCGFGPDLSAYLDGEPPSMGAEPLREHLAACAACSQALRQLRCEREDRVALFREVQAAAPPVPAACRKGGEVRKATGWPRILLLAGTAAILLLLLPVVPPGGSAGAAEVLAASMRAWSRVEDVHVVLHARVQAAGDAWLSRDWWFRGFVKRPDRFLFGEIGEAEGRIHPDRPIVGFDGETRWSWDPRRGRLTTGVQADLPLRLRSGLLSLEIAADRARLLRFLYEELPARIGKGDPAFNVVASKREGGSRCFHLVPGEEVDRGLLARLRTVEIRVAERTHRLEALRARLTLAGTLTFVLDLRTIAVNQGHDPGLFRWTSHLDPGTPVFVEEPR